MVNGNVCDIIGCMDDTGKWTIIAVGVNSNIILLKLTIVFLFRMSVRGETMYSLCCSTLYWIAFHMMRNSKCILEDLLYFTVTSNEPVTLLMVVEQHNLIIYVTEQY